MEKPHSIQTEDRQMQLDSVRASVFRGKAQTTDYCPVVLVRVDLELEDGKINLPTSTLIWES